MKNKFLQLGMMVLALGTLCNSGWANLIVNGDFETPDAAGWTLTNNTATGTGVWSATGGDPDGCYLLYSSGDRTGNEDQLYLQQGVNVTPNTEYTFSFDYTQGGNYAYSKIQFWQTSSSGWLYDMNVYDYIAWGWAPSLDAVTEWTAKTQSITVPANCTYVRIGFYQNQGWWGAPLYIDNVSFDVPVPEPATMCLLGIGSVFAMLRRRHR